MPLAEVAVEIGANTVAQTVPQSEESGKKRVLEEEGAEDFSKTFTTSGDRIFADLNEKGTKKLSIAYYRGKPMIHVREVRSTTNTSEL